MINFIEEKDINFDRVQEILIISKNANHYTNNGPVKKLLESKLEEILEIDKSKSVLCINNGTAALHCIMNFCNYKYGAKKWLTPAFTFPSSVVGNIFNVDICDIDLDTFTIPYKTNFSKYDGIIITNLFGSYVDLEYWDWLKRKYNFILIFDNAASPLSKYNGINICNFGEYSFGSLHHTKYLGFGEGGFIICPKEDYNLLTSITNFGFYIDTTYEPLSSNFKMSDITAAFQLSFIENFDFFKYKERQKNIVDIINKLNYAKTFNFKNGTIYNNLPILFDKPIDGKFFLENNIKIHKYYKPLKKLPNSMFIYDRIISFPYYNKLEDNDLNKIASFISICGS